MRASSCDGEEKESVEQDDRREHDESPAMLSPFVFPDGTRTRVEGLEQLHRCFALLSHSYVKDFLTYFSKKVKGEFFRQYIWIERIPISVMTSLWGEGVI